MGINRELLIQLFGACFVIMGLAAWLGLWKKWYWRSRGAAYGYIPLGLVFILYSFHGLAAERLSSYYRLYQGLIALLIVVGVWWSVRPPSFVKPAWVRWVEEYPENIRKEMARAVEEGEEWEAHVVSQEALKTWVKTLRWKKRKSKG